jgi:hypothetical protein
MCHMLLSDIQQQESDKLKLQKNRVCGLCDDFATDEHFSNIGTCKKRDVTVWKYQDCKAV